MSVITEMKVAKGKKSRHHIYIDNQFVATLDEFTVFKHKLKEGMEIDIERLEDITFESEASGAFELAVNLISKTPKTKKQMYDYLKSKGYMSKLIHQVIAKLEEYRYLNDEFYAESFVNCYANKYGKRKLEFMLSEKGVSKEIVERIFDEKVRNDDTVFILAKKYMKNKEFTQENFTKLARNLAGKGFEWSEISYAINLLKEGVDENWN